MASVFVADTHIDIHDHCRIGQFIRFLEFLEQQNITIYILGDLFNFWAGQAQSRLSAVQPLLQAMARLSNRLYFLGGNRDFLFARYWKKRGYQVIADGTIVVQNGQSLMLLHGDKLCAKDVNYQRMKLILQSSGIYYLSCLLPATFCLAIGRRMRQLSQQSIKRKLPGKMHLDHDYIIRTMQQQADILICGHAHHQDILTLKIDDGLVQVYILPECTGNSFHYLLWDDKGGRFERFKA